MRRYVGGDAIIGPLARSLHQQANALILDQPIRLYPVLHLIHAIDPRALPHRPCIIGSRECDVWRAAPREVIQVDDAIGTFHAADFHANFGNRRATCIGDEQREFVDCARFEFHLRAGQAFQAIFGSVNAQI